MKKLVKTTLFALVVAFVVIACAQALAGNTPIAYAEKKESPIYSFLTDDIIALYEEDVAGEAVVTNVPSARLEKLAKEHGFSLQKTKALIILSDLSRRVDQYKTFKTLAKMTDKEIFKFGKHLVDEYGKTLTEEEKQKLKQKALNALK